MSLVVSFCSMKEGLRYLGTIQSLLFLHGHSTLCFSFLNFIQFSWAHYSSLSRSLWVASRPSAERHVISKIAEGALDLSVSLMETLKSTGGTPLITDLPAGHWAVERIPPSLSSEQPTLQFHVSPTRSGYRVRPCWRPYRSLNGWPVLLFPCQWLPPLHHRRAPDWSGRICS